MFLRGRGGGLFFNSLRFWTNISILLVRWRALEVEWEVPRVGKTSYHSMCPLNRAEKISAASEVEISSEMRSWCTGDRIAENSASIVSQSMVEESVNSSQKSSQVARGDSALPSWNKLVKALTFYQSAPRLGVTPLPLALGRGSTQRPHPELMP